MTQKELSKKIGISASNITKYEIGQLEPNLEIITKLSKVFNVPISALIIDDFNNSSASLDLLDKFETGNITDTDINKLTKCILLAVISKYNLDIDIYKIADKDKKLVFELASASVATFINNLIENNNV
ncbi:helix-turn-helix transcriptional regulator [Clostridium botulinum]|nr:helix-turn-helix transcriptional regulator [Clostridium botulinum]